MRKLLQRWKERQSNNGSSLVMVISIVAIIGILAFSLLTVTLITYKMKNTNMNSKKNFYDAEKVMDDISLGLQADISKAAGEAYAWTLENFSGDSTTEEIRRSNYVNKFYDKLLDSLLDTSVANTYALHYKVDHLKQMVSPEVIAEAQSVTVKAAGGLNIINQDINAGTYTIKNLNVKYTDKKNYTTEIQTDVVLSCPKLNFNQMGTIPLDLTTFALVANDKMKTSGNNIEIVGSAFLGNQGTDISTGNDISFNNPVSNSTCRIITGGNVNVEPKGTITVEDCYHLWARSLILDGADADVKGQTYLNNDIVLDTLKTNAGYISPNLKMSGSLFAYGSPNTAGEAEIYRKVYKKDNTEDGVRYQKSSDPYYSDGDFTNGDQSLLDVNEADFSSAVLVNGRNATIDFSNLDEMVLAGNAYVGASLKDSANSDVKMGETLSLKSDQRAYLVPPEYIAPYCKNGGQNPMLSNTYFDLNTEIRDKFGYADDNAIPIWEYVRANENAYLSIPEALAKDGVVDIRRVVYRLSNVNATAKANNMVYFFLVFNSEESANKYAEKYWNSHSSTLKGRLYPYFNDGIYEDSNGDDNSSVQIKYPSGLNLETPGEFNTYFNGCVLLPAKENTKFYPGMLKMTNKYQDLDRDEANYQLTYASLRHKLTVDSASMTAVEGSKELYDNLVISDMKTGVASPKIGIDPNNKRVFTQDGDADTQMCAVVVNGNYEIPEDAEENVGGKKYPIHAIIANGNVNIPNNRQYKGLVLAHGTVTIGAGAKLTADTALAQQALSIFDATSSTCAQDFLINGSMYTVNNTNNTTDTEDQIDFSQYVAYSNWTKQ